MSAIIVVNDKDNGIQTQACTHTHTVSLSLSKNQLTLHPPNHRYKHNNDCYNTHRFPLGACEDNTIRRLLASPDLKRLILSRDCLI